MNKKQHEFYMNYAPADDSQFIKDLDELLSAWISIDNRLPKDMKVVETKIDDEDGIREVKRLIYYNYKWFIVGTNMYIHYTPTHWRAIKND